MNEADQLDDDGVVVVRNLENKMNRNKVFLISALVLSLILQACSSNTIAFSTPTDIIVAVPNATTPPGSLQVTPVPFGSDVNIDHMKFVITGTIRPADGIVSSGDIFNAQPHEYQQYIFVTLAVTCKMATDQQCHLDKFKIKLLGSDDTIKYPKWFISGVESILKETDLQGGTTISGNVPFIISVGDSGLLLIYESLSGDSFYLALP
jgi:hypothetical protein